MRSLLITEVLARIGDTDCEELGDGFLAQPVNALTSFSYVLVGLVIAVVAWRGPHDRARSWVYAACVAAVGLGSVAFHGPQPGGSRLMHDLPILLTAMFIVCHDLSLLFTRFRRVLPTFAVASLLALAIGAVSLDAVLALTGAALLTVAACEVLIYRRRLRPVSTPRQRRAYVAIIAVAVVAGLTWLLGRTDAPVCEPDSVLQLHGVWHAISALIFGLWWWLAFDQPVRSSDQDRQPAETAQ